MRELPPPSLRTFEKRNGYHYATLRKYLPDECRAVQERYREYCAASIQERQAEKIAEFRQIAHQLHEQGTDLFVNRVLTRMSVPNSLEYRIAREVLAEIKREIRESETNGRMTRCREMSAIGYSFGNPSRAKLS